MLRYAITDRARFVAESGQQAEPHLQSALLAQAARLTADGIDFIQLRERDLSAAALASLAHRLLATLRADLTHPAPGSSSTPAPTSPSPPAPTEST